MSEQRERYIIISEVEYKMLRESYEKTCNNENMWNESKQLELDAAEEAIKILENKRTSLSIENDNLKKQLDKRNNDFKELAEKVRAYMKENEK